MKVIYNNIIPFPGFKAINLFGVLFVRNGCTMSESDINHKMIFCRLAADAIGKAISINWEKFV